MKLIMGNILMEDIKIVIIGIWWNIVVIYHSSTLWNRVVILIVE